MNISSLVDAIKKASLFVIDSEKKVDLIYSYIENYQIVGKVYYYFDTSVPVNGNTAEVLNPESIDSVITTDVSFWLNYFILKDFQSDSSIVKFESTENNDLLTIDYIEKQSPVKDNILTFTAPVSYKDDIDLSVFNTLYKTAILPFSLLEQNYLKTNTQLVIDKILKWDIRISFLAGDTLFHVGSQSGSDILTISEANLNTTLVTKNISFIGNQFNQSTLDSVLKIDGYLSRKTFIPEDVQLNFILFKDIMESSYLKAGDKCVVEFNAKQDSSIFDEGLNDLYLDPENINSFQYFEKNYIIQKDNLNEVTLNILEKTLKG